MSNVSTITKRSVLIGDTPKSIYIGEENNFVFKKFSIDMDLVICVDFIETICEDGFQFSSISVSIGIAPKILVGNISLANIYAQGKHLKSTPAVKYEQKEKKLTCSSLYSILVDKNNYKFNVGVDGYYGSFIEHSKILSNMKEEYPLSYGYNISLVFDDKLWDCDELVQIFTKLFNAKPKTLVDKIKSA